MAARDQPHSTTNSHDLLAVGQDRQSTETGAPQCPKATANLVKDADDYTASITALEVDAIRIGRGPAPCRVLSLSTERVAATSCEIGFPMLTHSFIPEDRIAFAVMLDTPAQSRWCGVPLQSNSVIVYGPHAEHLAINQPGLRFTFGVARIDVLREVADRLGLELQIPPAGSVQRFPTSPSTRATSHELHRLVNTDPIAAPRRRTGQRALRALAGFFATERPLQRIGHGRGFDSRQIVLDCVEFADETGRIPSMSELIAAANVSERRLRVAFTDEFDRPPSQFFRAWALKRANRRLRQAESTELTVTEVAMQLGFEHLGRFAAHYRRMYGESPSSTLRGQTRLAM
jgi:AraC-like DNA-binding protein